MDFTKIFADLPRDQNHPDIAFGLNMLRYFESDQEMFIGLLAKSAALRYCMLRFYDILIEENNRPAIEKLPKEEKEKWWFMASDLTEGKGYTKQDKIELAKVLYLFS